MAQVIQVKRRIPGTGKPASGTGAGQVTAGELATSISATGATGIADLYIGDGTYVHDLVSAARQVELTGNQSIAGNKTFTGQLAAAPTVLHITGGADGEVLMTDGNGNLSWLELPQGVQSGGTAPTPAVAGDLWWDTGTTPNQLRVYNGTAWVSVAANYLPLIGGTLTGALTGTAATFTSLAVPTITSTGNLTITVPAANNILLPHDPTVNLGAATKQYVDAQIGTASAITAFSPTETYAIGDFVIQGGHLWRAHAANGPAAWSATNWDQISTAADLAGYLPLTGGTLTGALTGTTLTLSGAVTATGVTSTANLTLTAPTGSNVLLPHAPTVDMAAANKKYVDDELDVLSQQLAAVSGALRFVGNYNAATSQVTTAATGTLTVGANLPAPATTNEGWYVIVTNDGTPTAPAPTVLMHTGDWIVSTGAQWIHVPLYHVAVTATNVGISQINAQTWNNVQAALGGIYTMLTTAGSAAVVADDVSIVGDGTTADPLEVALVDGGTF